MSKSKQIFWLSLLYRVTYANKYCFMFGWIVDTPRTVMSTNSCRAIVAINSLQNRKIRGKKNYNQRLNIQNKYHRSIKAKILCSHGSCSHCVHLDIKTVQSIFQISYTHALYNIYSLDKKKQILTQCIFVHNHNSNVFNMYIHFQVTSSYIFDYITH